VIDRWRWSQRDVPSAVGNLLARCMELEHLSFMFKDGESFGTIAAEINSSDRLKSIEVGGHFDAISADLLKQARVTSLSLTCLSFDNGYDAVDFYRTILKPGSPIVSLSLDEYTGEGHLQFLMPLLQGGSSLKTLEVCLDGEVGQANYEALVEFLPTVKCFRCLILNFGRAPQQEAIEFLLNSLRHNYSIERISINKGAEHFSATQHRQIQRCAYNADTNRLFRWLLLNIESLPSDVWPIFVADLNQRYDPDTALFEAMKKLAPRFKHFSSKSRRHSEPYL